MNLIASYLTWQEDKTNLNQKPSERRDSYKYSYADKRHPVAHVRSSLSQALKFSGGEDQRETGWSKPDSSDGCTLSGGTIRNSFWRRTSTPLARDWSIPTSTV